MTVALAGPAAADPEPKTPSPQQGPGHMDSDVAARVAAIDAELAAARAAVERAAREAALAAEAHNKARAESQQRDAEAAAAAAAADAAAQAAQGAADTLSQHAAEVFQGGGALTDLDVFFGDGPQSVLDRAAALDAVGEERARVLRDADAASQRARTAQHATSEARERQQAAEKQARQAAVAARARAEQVQVRAEQVQARQEQLAGELAALRRTDARAEGDRQAALTAAEQVRHEEENRRRAEGGTARQPAGQSPGAPAPGQVAPRGGVQAVLAFAEAQRGAPYAWGAAGPDSWDCSGLTMTAWAQAGVRLGHYTGTQWAQTRQVPLAQAQPGDLVFYGTSTEDIYHVGLYLGGGRMIHAPRTGDVVKVSSIYAMGDLLPSVGRP